MDSAEIDLKHLKLVVNAVLDHIIEDLGIERLPIELSEDLYWENRFEETHDVSKDPAEPGIGKLSDDLDLIASVRRGDGADISYNLVHVFPLLRYIANKVQR